MPVPRGRIPSLSRLGPPTAAILLVLATAAFAQTPGERQWPAPGSAAPVGALQSPADAPTGALPPGGPPPVGSPSVFDTVGRWFDSGVQSLGAGAAATREAVESAASAPAAAGKGLLDAAGDLAKGAGDAAASLGRLPGTLPGTTITGREKCPIAANGGSDCAAAAAAMCRARGFRGGSSLDSEASQTCSTKALIVTQNAKKSCYTEHVVTRAVCQ